MNLFLTEAGASAAGGMTSTLIMLVMMMVICKMRSPNIFLKKAKKFVELSFLAASILNS